ncbi:YfhO family protein [Algivirga pacifica]|uniref:YfhO family protein n=1 Tax=Algivirga pacifica TaxID=1162670 RepID=A0ABP9DN18_9BACT
MKRFNWQASLPYILAIPIFYLITMVYFQTELLEGNRLPQGDILQFQGMKHLSEQYTESHDGEAPLWNVAMFGGFPEYLIASFEDGPLRWVETLTRGFIDGDTTASVFFRCMLLFWVTLLCFRVNPYLAIIGGIAFAFNTFYVVSTEAGHMTKMWAIAYAGPVLGGMALIRQRKFGLGFAVFALAVAMELRANHLQITYYLIFACVVYTVSILAEAIKEKDFGFITKAAGVLLLGAVLAGATQTVRLWTLLEYTPYSTRGEMELTPLTEGEGQAEEGLSKEYAFSWSQGKAETLTLFVPNLYGGASYEEPKRGGAFEQALSRVTGNPQQAAQIVSREGFRVPTYHGDQPFTAGPIYMGAVIFFLFILGLVMLDNKQRVWMTVAIVLLLMFSWGRNLQWFNYLLFDYFPGFNKFRSVSMAQGLATLLMSLMGYMGLQKLLEEKGEERIKKLFTAAGIAAGMALLVMVTVGMMDMSAQTPDGMNKDMSMVGRMFGIKDANVVKTLVKGLEQERVEMARSSAMRSLVLVLLAAGLIWAVLKQKVSKQVGLLIIGLVLVGDVWLVAKNYLNDTKYLDAGDKQLSITKTEADKRILQDESYYRVMTLGNTFQEARTSYFHKSIGGYFAAKMRRYQDMIERQFVQEQQVFIASLQSGQPDFSTLKTINMLNTKYIKFGDKAEQVLVNPEALGNAWFVNNVITVNTADDEMTYLGQIDPENTAIINTDQFELSKEDYAADSTATATLQSFDNRHIEYQTSSTKDGLVVFSEVYYPKGWVAKIDGKEVDVLRANYILRALEVPAGTHTITFDFEPTSYVVGSTITLSASYLMFALALLAIGWSVYSFKKSEEEAVEVVG